MQIDTKDLIEVIHSYGVNPVTREIFLTSYGNDETEGWLEHKTATHFEKNLKYLEGISKEEIIVHLHCDGGYLPDALAMYDTIQTCDCHVKMICYAGASSASGIVFQAADQRLMLPHSYYLIHDGGGSPDGNLKSIASWNEFWGKTYSEKVENIFAQNMVHGKFFKDKKYNEEKVKKYIQDRCNKKEDWYLTAEESVLYGLADGVINV